MLLSEEWEMIFREKKRGRMSRCKCKERKPDFQGIQDGS